MRDQVEKDKQSLLGLDVLILAVQPIHEQSLDILVGNLEAERVWILDSSMSGNSTCSTEQCENYPT